MTHGTSGAYKNGCRCDECRAAKSARDAIYRERGPLDILPGIAKETPRVPLEVRQLAACSGMGTQFFYPGRGDDRSVAHAKRVCERCPVINGCLLHALSAPERVGVWGGTSSKERRPLRSWYLASLRDGSSTALPEADPSPAPVPAQGPGSPIETPVHVVRNGGHRVRRNYTTESFDEPVGSVDHHFHGDRIA